MTNTSFQFQKKHLISLHLLVVNFKNQKMTKTNPDFNKAILLLCMHSFEYPRLRDVRLLGYFYSLYPGLSENEINTLLNLYLIKSLENDPFFKKGENIQEAITRKFSTKEIHQIVAAARMIIKDRSQSLTPIYREIVESNFKKIIKPLSKTTQNNQGL